MEKASAAYTRATSNSWLAKHWELNVTLSSAYATKKRSMTKSFVASSTTSTSLKPACSDADNSLRVSARQRPRSNAYVTVRLQFDSTLLSLRAPHLVASHIPLPTQPACRDRRMERVGTPRHRSRNPRGEGERVGN